MKLTSYSRNLGCTASLLGSFCLAACGQMGPSFLEDSAKNGPAVRLAGPEQHQSNLIPKGSYLVMFRSQQSNSNLFFASFADEYAHHYSVLSESFLADNRIKEIDVLTSVDMGSIRAVDWEPDFSLPKVLSALAPEFEDSDEAGVLARVDFTDEDAAHSALKEWERDGKILFAEPNEVSKLAAGEFAKWGSDYSKLQEWHRMIKLPEALTALGAGTVKGAGAEDSIFASGAVIAVLDSGVDYEHPQLKDNIWTNSSVGAAGCSGDVHGCNTTAAKKGSLGNGDVWPVLADGPGQACGGGTEKSKCNHGTHVAGLVAAQPLVGGTSGNLVGGVCPVCKIMILRVTEVEKDDTSGDPQIRDDSQVRAFKYLTRFRKSGGSAVRVVNASFGKYSRSRSLAILVDVLKRVGSGTLVIGAGSNEDSMIRSYPAALSNAVAVAAVGLGDNTSSVQKANFSNYGPWVDIAAPGVNLISTISGSAVGPQSGTSMASPVVAGAAGLLLSAFPSLTYGELRDRLLNTASASRLYGSELDSDGGAINLQYYYPKVSGESVRRPLLGGGLLDVNGMLNNSKNSATGQPIERVTAGCGVIGADVSTNAKFNGQAALIFLLFSPLLVVLFRRKAM